MMGDKGLNSLFGRLEKVGSNIGSSRSQASQPIVLAILCQSASGAVDGTRRRRIRICGAISSHSCPLLQTKLGDS